MLSRARAIQYGRPQMLFTAEFMGSNNRPAGELLSVLEGSGEIRVEGGFLRGEIRNPELKPGAQVTAMIRLERVRMAESGGSNRVRLPLVTSMFLGDRWEHLFNLGPTRLRAYGSTTLAAGEYWLELPAADLWLF